MCVFDPPSRTSLECLDPRGTADHAWPTIRRVSTTTTRKEQRAAVARRGYSFGEVEAGGCLRNCRKPIVEARRKDSANGLCLRTDGSAIYTMTDRMPTRSASYLVQCMISFTSSVNRVRNLPYSVRLSYVQITAK